MTEDNLINIDAHTSTENSEFHMTRCTRSRCVTCSSRLCLDNFVTNHVTGEVFYIDFNGSCDTTNCIYVIKCEHPDCQYQYTGHTINKISSRVSQHKSTIVRGGGCKVLREHFTSIHSLDNLKIMPIALLPIEASTLKSRESIEDDWMLKLNTVFPYGLNLRVKKVGIMDASIDII